MELNETADDRGRIARVLLAAVLGIVAISSLRKGKRLSGALAGAGAVALGYQATTQSADLGESLDIDSVGEGIVGEAAGGEADEFRCAACGEPIQTGQARGPNENNEIVHTACKASAE